MRGEVKMLSRVYSLLTIKRGTQFLYTSFTKILESFILDEVFCRGFSILERERFKSFWVVDIR